MRAGPYHTEKLLIIAGSALGLVVGLPYGPWGLVFGLIIGALAPLSLIVTLALLISRFNAIFPAKGAHVETIEKDPEAEL
jgi:hypothetical protein